MNYLPRITCAVKVEIPSRNVGESGPMVAYEVLSASTKATIEPLSGNLQTQIQGRSPTATYRAIFMPALSGLVANSKLTILASPQNPRLLGKKFLVKYVGEFFSRQQECDLEEQKI